MRGETFALALDLAIIIRRQKKQKAETGNGNGRPTCGVLVFRATFLMSRIFISRAAAAAAAADLAKSKKRISLAFHFWLYANLGRLCHDTRPIQPLEL